MDTLSPDERSKRMSLVHSKNTRPEMIVRKLVYALGYRYRLHDRNLPGSPDLVFTSRRSVIFVHGCFWHQHSCVLGGRMPKSRLEFWRAKLSGNRVRDRRTTRKLRRAGWRILVVWECQLDDPAALAARITKFLEMS